MKKLKILFSIFLFILLILAIKSYYLGGQFWKIMPPILAISLAFLTGEVILSLLSGIFLGIFFTIPIKSISLGKIISIPLKFADTYLVNAFAEPSHAKIILFSLMLAGVIGVISKSGAAWNLAMYLSKKTKSPLMAQFIAWFLGVAIFFDDYANTLIVGNVMRPITDKFRVSREKLAYIVDSTSAPVASLAVVSTWIGYEIALIADVFHQNGFNKSAYIAFLGAIGYRFYSIAALFLVLATIILKREFGPMYEAQKRSFSTGKVLRDGAKPLFKDLTVEKSASIINAVVPIVTLVLVIIIGLYYTGVSGLNGKPATFQNILANADSFTALLWASFIASVVAIFMVVKNKVMDLSQAINAWIQGVEALNMAMIVLVLAWSLAAITSKIGTADYLAVLAKQFLKPQLLPTIIFLLGAITSFSTGTSWGTMGVIVPIAVSVILKVDPNLLYPVIGAAFAGAIFGDHCSPMSDTTIMSSMASGCDHIDHVKTQLPYAVMGAFLAVVFGYLPAGFGVSWMILVPVLIGAVFLTLKFIGNKVEVD